MIGAIGVVYGDIGTSPLYTVNQAFFGIGKIPVTQPNILGVISLILWVLTLIVSIQYIFFVLRASYQGEGGVFALHELLAKIERKHKALLLIMLIFAASLLLGDGMITPAISVLSAVEGLKVTTSVFSPYIIYITAIILSLLFVLQRKGTAKVGSFFGPIMIIWFIAIAMLGFKQIIGEPQILSALNPVHAIEFGLHIGLMKLLLAIGAVTLAVTGAEALYADLGHFGKSPIRTGWFTLVYWALLLNYLGQGAYLLSGRTVMHHNVFFSLIPTLNVGANYTGFLGQIITNAPVYFMVILATTATIIASQALITGAFSLASQAVALGMIPRLNIIHTNEQHEGQLYVPAVNWLLYIGCIILIFAFRTSGNLAAAYGMAVSGVMVSTSLSMILVARDLWKWGRVRTVLVFGTFVCITSTLLLANSLKLFKGGYVPLAMGAMVFIMIIIWRWGRRFVNSAYSSYLFYTTPKDMNWLIDVKKRLSKQGILKDKPRNLVEMDRAVVFLVSKPIEKLNSSVPIILRIYMKRQGTLPKHLILLTIVQEKKPFVMPDKKIEIIDFGNDLVSVKAHFGFMQQPDGFEVLRSLKSYSILKDDLHRCTIEAAEEELFIGDDASWVNKIRVYIYRFFSNISLPAYHYFGLDAKPGIAKTVIPILLNKEGWRIDLPEFALENIEEQIDPDTRKPTELQYIRKFGG